MPGPGGPPPKDSEKRCHAKRRNGKRCRRWALRTSKYCQFHGGRRKDKVRISHLPRFYSHHLKGTLQERVEECLGASPSEQLSLFEELALMRVTAAQVVALWGAADGTEAAPAAGSLMRDALKDVISTCQVAANIETQAKDKFSIHALHHIISQIVRIAYECFDDDPRAKRFEQLIKDKIKMPIEQTGTLLTPDQDAVDMDDTIPKE